MSGLQRMGRGLNADASSRVVIAAILLAAWGGLVLLLGYDLVQSRADQYAMAMREADNLTRVFERHVGATVEKIDIVLRETARDFSQPAASLPASRARLLRHMDVIDPSQLESLVIVGPDGRVTHESSGHNPQNLSVADRAYFQRQKADADAGLIVSEPLLSRLTGRWAVALTRRLPSPDGGFAGVIAAAMPVGYIQTLFDSLSLGQHGSIALYDSDMRLVARHPVLPEQVGKAYPLTEIKTGLSEGRAIGTYNVVSRVDGIPREYFYRKLDGLPFVVLVGQSPEDFLGQWNRKAILYAISLLAMSLELAAMLFLLRKLSHDRLAYVASHDSLTNLPNRTSLSKHLPRHAKSDSMALLAMDLDHFKNINDTLGHDLGDLLLRQVAERLRTTLRDGDTVTRQGGDEFVVVMKDCGQGEVVAHLAQRLLDTLERPFFIDGHELVVTASIGIAVYPQHGTDINTLLKNADAAMFEAKRSGRNGFRFFTQEMNDQMAERLNIETGLRKALANDELCLQYQPQFETHSGRLIGFEALLRWKHPEYGMVGPGRFIPIAEETGLIIPIGEWVLREACRQNKAWQEAGLPPVVVAVNLSAVQFRQLDLADMVAHALAESGLDPAWLELEVTESALMHDVEQVIATLHQLNDQGVQLSIDDFGTGYSSLSYLKRFPIHKIKIDQSFVRDVEISADGAAIVQSIIAIANKMGLRAIAEGVETHGHLDAMHSFGCDEVQGFLFGRAVPPDEAHRFFAAASQVRPSASHAQSP